MKMIREILELIDNKIDTSGILLMTKINQKNSACDKIARPYFHFSLTRLGIRRINVLSGHVFLRLPAYR